MTDQENLINLLIEESVVVGCCNLDSFTAAEEIVEFIQENDPTIARIKRQNSDLVKYNSEQVIKRREAFGLLRELDLEEIYPDHFRRRIQKCLENEHVHEE